MDLNVIQPEEWSMIKELIEDEIDRIDKEIGKLHEVIYLEGNGISDDEIRSYGESRQLRNHFIVIKEKIDWIKIQK